MQTIYFGNSFILGNIIDIIGTEPMHLYISAHLPHAGMSMAWEWDVRLLALHQCGTCAFSSVHTHAEHQFIGHEPSISLPSLYSTWTLVLLV